MNNEKIAETALLKDLRKASNPGEILDLLRKLVDHGNWDGVDLILFSEDLGAFFFPADTEGEPDNQAREAVLEGIGEGIEESDKYEDGMIVHSILEGKISSGFTLIPLHFKEHFLGFLLLVKKPGSDDNKAAEATASHIASLCEDILFMQAREDHIEKLTLENEAMKADLSKSENLKLLGQMIGGITHDFNNIFTGVIGYSQLIQMMSDDEETKDSIGEILKAAENGRKEIKFLQETKKIDKDEEDKEIDVVKIIQESVDNMIRLSGQLMPGKELGDIFRLTMVESPGYKLPPVHLKQLFMTLFAGFLRKGYDRVDIKPENGPEGLKISIDFSRSDKPVDPLPLKREKRSEFPGILLFQHLGYRLGFDMQFAPGKVVLFFPLPGTERKRPRLGILRNKKILIYERDPVVRQMFKWVFKKMNSSVEAPMDVDELDGIIKTRLGEFDRVLLDMGAYPLLQDMDLPENAPPIILISSWGPLLQAEQIDEEKVSRILPKPFTLQELAGVME